jgi:NADPH-dependent 2,4-dienoyl-CoA reductase/sulfur reductase-like enzyme
MPGRGPANGAAVNDDRHLVVVGASLAGLRAVEGARKSGFGGRITLVGGERHLPYDRPPLSKAFLDADTPAWPVFRAEETLRVELGVELLLGTPATGLDTGARRVRVGDSRTLEFDALVIATGAHARTLPGALRGVHTLRTIDDAVAIRAALDSGAATVVVGGGFIGSEIASGARKRGLPVTVVEALPTPLVRAVGEVMGARLAALHTAGGTDLRCGVGVAELLGDGAVEGVALTDGTVIPADLVVVGIGSAPSTGWLDGSGLAVDNGVVCDETLRAGVEGIYAAGDVANWPNPALGRRTRLEHWTSAAEQGAHAARNALNPEAATAYTTVPYFWSDWYGARIQFVGSPHGEEVAVVEERGPRTVALYRSGERLCGALTVNGQAEIMKYRGLITQGASWADALDFSDKRRAAKVARGA